jgi:hypothetical protein
MAPSRLSLRQRFGRSEMPVSFWYLWLGTLVNRLGGFAVPFLMLYLTTRLGDFGHRLTARPTQGCHRQRTTSCDEKAPIWTQWIRQ